MKPRTFLPIICFIVAGGIHSWMPIAQSADYRNDNWPQWRGIAGDGKAAVSQVPLEWNLENNVLWKSVVPGRGHSSPTVCGDLIYLTTADESENVQAVIAFDRNTGEQQWKASLFEGGLDKKSHERNSQASCTVASADGRVFAAFMNDQAVWIVALSEEGKELWRKRVGDFVSFWGYSASPTIYKSMLLIAADHSEGGYVAALDQATGKILWKQQRPHQRNYPSPIVYQVSGRDQLLLAGCNRLSSYDPNTGEEFWETKTTTQECVGSVVVDGDLAFASGGYPDNITCAVQTDGSAEVVWGNGTKIYVPSMVAHDGQLFGVTDTGILYCWNSQTGEELWKKRLGGTFNASLVLVNDSLVATSEEGTFYVVRADPEGFELIAENKLGQEVYATPTFCNNKIYIRVAEFEGDERQESLYCIGAKK